MLRYLGTLRSLRGIVTAVFNWRVAGVLIGAGVLGAVFTVMTLSCTAGLCGAGLGAAAFSCLFYIPSDSRLALNFQRLQNQIADFDSQQNNYVEQFSRMTTELADCQAKRQGWSDYLREVQQSRQYRRQQLVNRNWKAMRGGDLERFLEEVFLELQYLVDRKGGAGDQGVDLVLLKSGHRIAVQVKGYVDSVPNTAIQEAHTGMVYHRCEACAVITNSRFTLGGRNIAESVGCALIDEDTLPMLIFGQLDLWQMILAARAKSQGRPATGPS